MPSCKNRVYGHQTDNNGTCSNQHIKHLKNLPEFTSVMFVPLKLLDEAISVPTQQAENVRNAKK